MLRAFFARLAAALVLLGLACPAQAAIGTPTDIGHEYRSDLVSSVEITPSQAVAAGETIVVALALGSGTSAASVTDTAGNVYVASDVTSIPLVGPLRIFYCADPQPLSPLDKITASWTGTTRPLMVAMKVSGLLMPSPLDQQGHLSSGTGTTGTAVSAAFGATPQLVLGVLVTNLRPNTVTHDASFNPLAFTGGGGGAELHWAWRIVNEADPVSYTATWETSRNYGVSIFSFRGTGEAPPAGRRRGGLSRGVGE